MPNDKPIIYAYCEAMCKYETVHKSDFDEKVTETETELDEIKERLRALGFKQGTVYYDNVAVDSTVASVVKQGNYAILDFDTTVNKPNKITLPDDFKPNPTKYPLGVLMFAAKQNNTVGMLFINSNGEININGVGYVVANIGYEIQPTSTYVDVETEENAQGGLTYTIEASEDEIEITQNTSGNTYNIGGTNENE